MRIELHMSVIPLQSERHCDGCSPVDDTTNRRYAKVHVVVGDFLEQRRFNLCDTCRQILAGGLVEGIPDLVEDLAQAIEDVAYSRGRDAEAAQKRLREVLKRWK